MASSDPVAKAQPLGKNCKMWARGDDGGQGRGRGIWGQAPHPHPPTLRLLPTYSHSIDVRLMTYECLSAHGIPDIPQLDGGVAGT